MAVNATALEESYSPRTGQRHLYAVPSPANRQPQPGLAEGKAIAHLAHELRTPLSTLHTTLELLEDFSSMDAEEVQHLLGTLRRSVTWMTGLVDNLSTSEALEDGRLRLKQTFAPVLDCIESAVALVQPLLARRDQHVRVVCADPAPLVFVDTLRIGQVIVNLLNNASTYGAWGEDIEVTVSVAHGEVQVTVTDSGPGIPEEEQQGVFGRGVRGARGSECRAGGQGLGLHIVKAIVELHGGSVGVSSVVGQGASFWFRLPSQSNVHADSAVVRVIQ